MGVWWQLILALLGGGIFTQGVVGLAMDGNLPMIQVPESLKPMAKLVHTLSLLIGMTLLLSEGKPDLVERVFAAIMS